MFKRIKQLLENRKKWEKICTAIGGVVVGLFLIAVVVGVLNALVADGGWNIGWSTYRYDETGYEIGGASIPSKSVTNIDIDWIDGDVEMVLCKDAFISITEVYEGEIAESEYLRYRLSEDKSSLSIKYRKSAAFVGFGKNVEKKLIVRIPEAFIAQLETVSVNSKSADVVLDGVTAKTLSVTTKRGDIDVRYPESCGFSLSLSCEKDDFISNLNGAGDGFVYGDGVNQIILTTKKGEVSLYTKK